MRRIVGLLLVLLIYPSPPAWAGRDFDGTDDFVSVSMSNALEPSVFTVCVWADIDANNAIVIAQGQSGTKVGWNIYINPTGNVARIEVDSVGDGPTNASGSTDIVASGYHHICITYDKNIATATGKLFVDGTQEASIDKPAANKNVDYGASNFRVGTSVTGDFDFNGRAGEATYWDIILPDTTIAALSNRIAPGRVRKDNIIHNWPLYGANSPEPDYSGNVSNGTVTGTTAGPHPPIALSWGFDYGWAGAFAAAAGADDDLMVIQ